MKKEDTLQEVSEQIEKCDIRLKQLKNQGKKLENLANEKERKRRNYRLFKEA